MRKVSQNLNPSLPTIYHLVNSLILLGQVKCDGVKPACRVCVARTTQCIYASTRGVRGPDKGERHCLPRRPKRSGLAPLTSGNQTAIREMAVLDHVQTGEGGISAHPTSETSLKDGSSPVPREFESIYYANTMQDESSERPSPSSIRAGHFVL